MAKLGAEYGVHPTPIHNWLRQLKEAAPAIFAGNTRSAKNKHEKKITAQHTKISQLTVKHFFYRGLKENMSVSVRAKLVSKNHRRISLVRPCCLHDQNLSRLYYKKAGVSANNLKLMKIIEQVFTSYPFLGYRQMR